MTEYGGLYRGMCVIAVLLAAGILCAPTAGDDSAKPVRRKTDPRVTPAASAPQSKWTQIVAEVNGEPISREQLADELLELYGTAQLEDVINRKLVEQACAAAKIEVTRAEIENEIDDRVKRLNLSRKEFFDRVLPKMGKSHRQYVRDTVWPAVALTKLVKGRVQVTDADLLQAFEARFGEKVEVRMLVVRELNRAQELWQKINGEKDLEKRREVFESLCKTYSIDTATQPFGGAAVVHRHTSVPDIEKAAFALQPGELSAILQVPQGNLILMCVAPIPPRDDVAMDTIVDEKTKTTVRDTLYSDLVAAKTREEVGKYFQEQIKKAKIQNYLTGDFSPDAVRPVDAVEDVVDPTVPQPDK
jgi:foldase protein PrsA